MAIDRKTQKVFGGNLTPSGNIAVYGSKEAGSPTFSDNVETIQSNSWLQGILGATSPEKAPYIADFNAIFYVITKQLAYLFQAGLAEWDSQTEYFANKSICQKNNTIYMCITDNKEIEPEVTQGWEVYWVSLSSMFGYEKPNYFSSDYATATGGYPQGAILDYTGSYGDTYKIKSLVNNNTTAPSSENIKKPSSDPAGTYYWEVVSNEFSQMFILNPNSTQKYARLVADGNGYLGIENIAGIALNNLGSLQIDGSGNLNLNFTTVTVNNNPILRLPNYNNKTNLTGGTNTKTVYPPSDGWICVITTTPFYDYSFLEINNSRILELSNQAGSGHPIFCPVKSTDTVTVRGMSVDFYPYR